MWLLHRGQESAGAPEWLIAFLGNPGGRFDGTRHNVGFAVADLLAEKLGIKINRLKFKSLYGTGSANARSVLLIKPQTFMNLSGEAVREAADFYKLPPERVIVVYDDVSLQPGRIRVRAKGSDGGHNGIKSIIYQLNSDAFPRVKVGVGMPDHPDYDLADWVLSRFPAGESKELAASLERARDAVLEIISSGAFEAMNRFNG
jgi:PTH1 family peptidyl-tRNA hydrolase